jgi:hypothetical protein
MFKPKSIVFFLLFILLIVTSCKKKEDSMLNSSFKIPETRDTFKLEVTKFLYDFQKCRGDTNNMFENYFFEPHFFGKENEIFYPKWNITYHEDNYDFISEKFYKKTIFVNKEFKANYDYYHHKKEYSIPSNGQLCFQLDFKNTKNNFTPVFVKNNCVDTFNIGFGQHVDIDVLIMNKDKEWVKIDHDYRYFCGTGLALILLLPKEICLTYLPELKKGNFKTQFRLRLRNAYSESYPVSIDESILENIKN